MPALRAPALAVCVVFVTSVALSRTAVYRPVGCGALLLLLGVALGGRLGVATAAAACGLLAVTLAPAATPPGDAGSRPCEVVGRVCSHGLRSGPRLSVELCADRLRRGPEVALGRWTLRLDLPEGALAPPLGARLRATGILGRAPGYDNRERTPPGRWSLRVKSRRFLRVEAPPPPPLAWAARARAAMEKGWDRSGERPGVALARAMVLGETGAGPPRWARALRRTGMAHLTAVSGFNVALVAGWAALVGALLPTPLRLTLAALSALAYLGLVGPAPALVRATAMALVAGLALLARRAPVALQALAVATLVLIATDPNALDDVGLQLSVAATAGLLLGTARLERGLDRLPKLLARGLAASLAAQAAASPASVATFGQVAAIAPLLNLILAPWAALVLIVGLASGGLAAAGAPDWMTAPALWFLDGATLPLELLARLPPSPWISAPATRTWLCGAAVGAFLALPAAGRLGRRAGFLAVLCFSLGGGGPQPPVGAEIVAFDVGQGDAILVRAGGHAALVDGGGARGRDLAVQVLLPALAARGITRLDLVVLTHLDFDHCGGLVDLASYLPFDELWLPRGALPTPCSRELMERVDAPIRAVAAGERRTLGLLELEVLHPVARARPEPGNRLSLALAIGAAGRRALLLGDLDGDGERRLARRYGARLRCDLLKVAHHGSAGSSTPELLALARPRLALVSAGVRNAYGHPAESALARLGASGARLLRTDRDGELGVGWRAGEPWRIELPGSPRRETGRGG